jgi:hypothetical protein
VFPFNANGTTNLYTVPSGKTLILSHAMIVVQADPNGTDVSIGQSGAVTDFVANHDMNLLSVADDACRLAPIPSATPALEKAYAAGTVIQANVSNQAGGGTNALYLFGTLY